MNEQTDRSLETPEPWWASLLGALYFLLASIGLIQNELPLDWDVPAGLRIADWLIVLGVLIPAVGLAVGWVLGFPRWSYPYIGGLLVYSLYLGGARTPLLDALGYHDQVWGWRIWLPFLLACGVGLLLSSLLNPSPQTPSPRLQRVQPSPLQPAGEGEETLLVSGVRAKPRFLFFSNLGQDPTLATYLMFGWMPLLIFIAFDEMDRLYTLVFILIFIVLMIATALLYQRLRTPRSRAWVLAVGAIACVLLMEVGVIAYWLPQDGVNVPMSLLWGVFILAVLLYPYLFLRRGKPVQEVSEA